MYVYIYIQYTYMLIGFNENCDDIDIMYLSYSSIFCEGNDSENWMRTIPFASILGELT